MRDREITKKEYHSLESAVADGGAVALEVRVDVNVGSEQVQMVEFSRGGHLIESVREERFH